MCSLWEKFRVIYVRSWSPMFAVWQLLGNHIDVVKRNFSFVTQTETHNSFHSRMDCLVKSHYHVVARLPFKSSLPCNDIVGINFLSPKDLDPSSIDSYPRRRPAESLVFCVEEACIFDALNRMKVVKACNTRGLDDPRPMIFMTYYFNYSPTNTLIAFNICDLFVVCCDMLLIQIKHSIRNP